MILTRNLAVALLATVISFATLYMPQPMLPMVRRAMGYYIGATILGGFGGRLLGGVLASAYDWRTAFVVAGLLQLLPLMLLLKADSDADINFSRLDPRSIFRVLARREYRLMFLALAMVFFVFSGILNLAPFHLRDLQPNASPLLISLLYLGYLVGVPISFYSHALGKRLRDERAGLLLGLGLHAFGLLMLLFVDFEGLVAMMFFLAAGFFLLHSLLSGLANHLASEHRGVVNGLYVSIYYLSGALGSWLPGYLYEGFAWQGMILLFFVLLAVCAVSIGRLRLTAG